MPRITISYRRDDSLDITGRIFDRLAAHFGRESVFRDIDNIPPGADFRRHIDKVLDESDVILAIVGPRWIGPRANQSRLTSAADPVRLEIETALRKDKPLIPVLVSRAPMPRPEQLPESLVDFAYRNAVQVDPGQDFDVHIARLIRAMGGLLGGAAQPPAEAALPTDANQRVPDLPPELDTLRAANAELEKRLAAVNAAHEATAKDAARSRDDVDAARTYGDGAAVVPPLLRYRLTIGGLLLGLVGLGAALWVSQQQQNLSLASQQQGSREAQAGIDQLNAQIKTLRDQLNSVTAARAASDGTVDQLNTQIKTLRDQLAARPAGGLQAGGGLTKPAMTPEQCAQIRRNGEYATAIALGCP